MKDFCIVYNKANKSLIKKLVTKLESDGINCTVAPRDYKQDEKAKLNEAIGNSKVLLMIIDNNAAKDKEMINALEYALENDKPVIPFVISKVESDLYSEHFFYSFSWVDAYEDSFEDAYEILIDAYEDLSGENAEAKKNKKNSKPKDIDKLMKNKPLLIAAAVLILALVAYFSYSYLSNEKQSQALVGEWQLNDYQDNVRRLPADSLVFVTQTLPSLKQRVLLVFNDDNTFERIGFTPEPQIGKWKFDAEKSTLNLVPYGATASTDELQIKNLTQNGFTIVAEELLSDSIQMPDSSYRVVTNKSVTKIQFRRKRQ